MGGGIMREIWDAHHIPEVDCWIDIDIIDISINVFYKKKHD